MNYVVWDEVGFFRWVVLVDREYLRAKKMEGGSTSGLESFA